MPYSTLIVARMNPASAASVSNLFESFDRTEMPHLMGTQRRELFQFHGLYFHLQDFTEMDVVSTVEAAKTDSRFIQISSDLRPYISPFDPAWRSPKDAMAQRFYHWETS